MFKPGNKFGGRKPGSKNKINNDIRLKFKELLENNIGSIQSILNELEPKDKIKAILDMAQYVLPKLRHTDLDANFNAPGSNDELLQRIYNMDDNDLNKLYDEDLTVKIDFTKTDEDYY